MTKPGARVTMADVARAAGVSKQTVSRVVNGTGSTSPETEARIRRLIRDLGYRPSGIARSLATNASLALGLIVPELDNPYYAEIAQGAELASWKRGYSMVLSNVFSDVEREEATLRSLHDRGADGVILDTPGLADDRLFSLLAPFKAAVVIGRSVPVEVAGSITVDDAAGIRLALRRLAAAGRRRIAFLAGPERFASNRVRRGAFVEAERERGTLSTERLWSAEPTAEASRALVGEKVASGASFDALICFNDVMAMGALRAFVEAGVDVPDDVAVVGHDDIPAAAWLFPPLSTLNVSKRDLGAGAVRMVVDRLNGRNQQVQMVLQPQLVVRESTGPLPQGA